MCVKQLARTKTKGAQRAFKNSPIAYLLSTPWNQKLMRCFKEKIGSVSGVSAPYKKQNNKSESQLSNELLKSLVFYM
jgi:hypothetical protein